MKGQKVTPDSLETRRYNCAYEKEDVFRWKQWMVQVEKPMNFVLIVSIIFGGILTVLGIIQVFIKYDQVTEIGIYFREMFLFQMTTVLCMNIIMYIGTKLVLYRIPRPPLERCLEVEYYNSSLKLYYLYERDLDGKGKRRLFIDKFYYNGIEVVRLGEDALLINGRKVRIAQPNLETLLTPIEHCKYKRYYGYLQGIHHFHYDYDSEKLMSDIYFFRDAMQTVHNREKKE